MYSGQVLHLWMVFLLKLCSYAVEIFPTTKKKGEIWCNLLLVFVRLGFMLVVIGSFHIRNLGSRVLGMRGGDRWYQSSRFGSLGF